MLLTIIFFYKKQHYLHSTTSVLTPTPSSQTNIIPTGTMLPAPFTQTSWKTYTSSLLGVSFAYPSSFKLSSEIPPQQSPYMKEPTIFEIPEHNNITVSYHYGYLLKITKVTTDQPFNEWVAQNDGNFIYHDAYEYPTTFNGYTAILSLETPEMVKNTQVPITIYYVNTNPNTIYQIEYEIPSPIPTDSTEDATLAKQENDIINSYIPQILGSIKFF